MLIVHLQNMAVNNKTIFKQIHSYKNFPAVVTLHYIHSLKQKQNEIVNTSNTSIST